MKKYTVYKNDLMYKKHRKINKENIQFDDAETENMLNMDLDTLEYRFSAARSSNFCNLDLKNLDLTEMPIIPTDIKKHIKHLFIGDNMLTSIPDLTEYINLETLEMSHNKISIIGSLPTKLIEINCSFNNIKQLPLHTKLQRLDCHNNELTHIPLYPELEILICSNNKLVELPHIKSLKKLICDNNNISSVPEFRKVKYLSISNNNILTLPKLPKVTDLICNNMSKPLIFSEMGKIKNLELFNTKVSALQYYSTLQEIYCSKDTISTISEAYKLKNIQLHKEHYLIISFDCVQK